MQVLEEREAILRVEAYSCICDKGFWHYVLETPIGDIHIIEWENNAKEINRAIIDGSYEKAVKKYNAVMRREIGRC